MVQHKGQGEKWVMKTFLKVGEFARVCHTTRETLLHYDRKGVLRPDHVSGNGYRRYSMKQFFDFDLIALLKETGSTLEEIRRCREHCGESGYLGLFAERIAVLEREQERIEHRLAMMKSLEIMGREALSAEYDRIFFESRESSDILVYPVDPEKITGRESSVECYSECLVQCLMNGNAVDPPLGVIIPEEFVTKRVFRICSIFTAAWRGTELGNLVHTEKGRYACLFHKGDVGSHGRTFGRMMRELAAMGLRTLGPVYAYDQMNYVLSPMGEEYIARYVVRVAEDEGKKDKRIGSCASESKKLVSV